MSWSNPTDSTLAAIFQKEATKMKTPSDRVSSFFSSMRYEHLVAGISGGIASTLILHPLDLIKIRFAGMTFPSIHFENKNLFWFPPSSFSQWVTVSWAWDRSTPDSSTRYQASPARREWRGSTEEWRPTCGAPDAPGDHTSLCNRPAQTAGCDPPQPTFRSLLTVTTQSKSTCRTATWRNLWGPPGTCWQRRKQEWPL